MDALWLSLAGLAIGLPVLMRVLVGWRNGITTEIRQILVAIFSILVALRFWEPLSTMISQRVTLDVRVVLVASFAILFVVANLVASVVVRLRAPVYRSFPRGGLDQALGILGGLFAGSLIGCAVGMLVTLCFPPEVTAGNQAALIESIVKWPEEVYRTVEKEIAQVPANDPSSTRFPSIVFSEVPVAANKLPEGVKPGSTLVMLQPAVRWNAAP